MNSGSSRAALTRHAHGWVMSLCCHLLGIGGAMYLFTQIEDPALSKPFQWDVAILEPAPPPPQSQPAPTPVTQARPKVQPLQEPRSVTRPTHESRSEVHHMVQSNPHVSPQQVAVSETRPVPTPARRIEQVVGTQSMMNETTTAYQAVEQLTEPVHASTGSREVQPILEQAQQSSAAISRRTEERVVPETLPLLRRSRRKPLRLPRR